MATFNLIINKIVNLDNNIFSYNYETDNIDGVNKIFFNLLNTFKLQIYKNKFKFLKETIDNFYFSSKDMERIKFLNLFNKIQKIYHILNRFVYLYKFKKSKLIVDIDMQLNQININEPNVICIYHVGSKYLFTIDDLLKMIYMSLTNCFLFFAEPISIKNPYNNISFGKSILYYIYSYLISSAKIKFIKPEYLDVFFKFKESNFNMTQFINNYEYILREYSIKNYLNNTPKTTKIEHIFRMIDIYNSNIINNRNKILIDPEFPDEELITIMKPYLYLSLETNYSLVGKNRVHAKNMLNQKLKEFQNFNPGFGRKIIKFKDIVHKEKIKRIRSHIGFNMCHKPFNNFNIENFMNNHLSYKYNEDERNYNDNDDHDNDDTDEEQSNDTRNIISTIRREIYILNLNNNNTNEEQEEQYEEELEQQYEEELEQQEQYEEELEQQEQYEEELEQQEHYEDGNEHFQDDSELSEEEYTDSVS
jgi:hypothetical protein